MGQRVRSAPEAPPPPAIGDLCEEKASARVMASAPRRRAHGTEDRTRSLSELGSRQISGRMTV